MRNVFSVIVLLIIVLTGCRNEEPAKPDIVIPSYVEKRVTVTWESIPTYVGLQFLPYGGEVFLYPGAFNEFYSVTRYSAQLNSAVKIYWNIDNPPPFTLFYFDPLFMPLQIGEKFTVYRYVTNLGSEKGDTESAGKSKTSFKKIVKVEGGEIIDDDVKKSTREIYPGEYVLLSQEYTFEGFGYYQFEFYADVDKEVPERDEENNYYAERETKNLTSN